MTIREQFRRAIGLDAEFADAERRWQAAPSRWPRRPVPSSPVIEKLRQRFQKELLDAQDRSDADFDAANERLKVLSPWYAPPTDAEVQHSRAVVKQALYAVSHALKTFASMEAKGVAWYMDSGEVPGIERGLVDQFGPGNEQRGRHDPVPVLLVCRDLLAHYLSTVDAERSALAISRTAYKRLVHAVATILFGGGAKTKEVMAVLASKGITGMTKAALDQLASRMRKHGQLLPTRGGAPRGPRAPRSRTTP